MSKNQELKQRIKSINSIEKITSVMNMISNAKFLKIKKTLDYNRMYINEIQNIIDLFNVKDIDHPYCIDNENKNNLYIIFGSDLGLCGSYNNKINQYILNTIKKDDNLIIISKKINRDLKKYKVIYSNFSENFNDFNKITEIIKDCYLTNKVGKVNIIYTDFINSFKQEIELKKILPLDIKNIKNTEILIEPSVNKIFEYAMDIYLTDVIKNCYIKSKLAENSARRNAMEQATKSANEFIDELVKEYNKNRQQAITQEITEIVAGSNE